MRGKKLFLIGLIITMVFALCGVAAAEDYPGDLKFWKYDFDQQQHKKMTAQSTSTGPAVWLEQDKTTVTQGDYVNVNIFMSDIADLYGASMDLSYDPTLLNVVDTNYPVKSTGILSDETVVFDADTKMLAQNSLTEGCVTVTSLDGALVYQENIDFTVDYTSGSITRLAVGGIGAGQSVLVDYTAKLVNKVDTANSRVSFVDMLVGSVPGVGISETGRMFATISFIAVGSGSVNFSLVPQETGLSNLATGNVLVKLSDSSGVPINYYIGDVEEPYFYYNLLVLPSGYEAPLNWHFEYSGLALTAADTVSLKAEPVGDVAPAPAPAPIELTNVTLDLANSKVHFTLGSGHADGNYALTLYVNGTPYMVGPLVIGMPFIWYDNLSCFVPTNESAFEYNILGQCDFQEISTVEVKIYNKGEAFSGVPVATAVNPMAWSENGSLKVKAYFRNVSGLIDGNIYQMVVTINGKPSWPYFLFATSDPIVYGYWPWLMEAGKTQYNVRIDAYNITNKTFDVSINSLSGLVATGTATPVYMADKGYSYLDANMTATAPVPTGNYYLDIIDTASAPIHFGPAAHAMTVQMAQTPFFYDLKPRKLPYPPDRDVVLYGKGLNGSVFDVYIYSWNDDSLAAGPISVTAQTDSVTGEEYLSIPVSSLDPDWYYLDVYDSTGAQAYIDYYINDFEVSGTVPQIPEISLEPVHVHKDYTDFELSITDMTDGAILWGAGEQLAVRIMKFGINNTLEVVRENVPVSGVTETELTATIAAGLLEGDYVIQVLRGTAVIAENGFFVGYYSPLELSPTSVTEGYTDFEMVITDITPSGVLWSLNDQLAVRIMGNGAAGRYWVADALVTSKAELQLTATISAGLQQGDYIIEVIRYGAVQEVIAEAMFHVTPPAQVLDTVEIQPYSPSVPVNGTLQFSLVGKDTAGNIMPLPAGTTVGWSVASGTATGTIDQLGLLTVGPAAGTLTVTATAGTYSAYTEVAVHSSQVLAGVDIRPDSPSVPVNGTLQFVVVGKDAAGMDVPIPAGTTVDWSVTNGTATGTIDQNGVLQVGTTVGTLTVNVIAGAFADSTVVTVADTDTAVLNILPRVGANPVTSVGLGQEFDVDVKLENVTDLCGSDVQLQFDPTVFEVLSIETGDIFSTTRNSCTSDKIQNLSSLDSSLGQVNFSQMLFGTPGADYVSTNGSGTIGTVHLRVVATQEVTGNISLRKDNIVPDGALFVNSNTSNNSIPFSSVGTWQLQVVSGSTVRGTAKLDSVSDTSGLHGGINIIIEPGDAVTTFTANTVSLADGSFTINGVPAGMYNLRTELPGFLRKVVALDLTNAAGEVIANDGQIIRLLAGNLNTDLKVDLIDLSIFARSWKKITTDAGFNANADFTRNGVVDLVDLSKFARNWKKSTL